MPKLKITIQKRTEDPWILNLGQPISNVYFTEQEITDVIRPYWQSVEQMTGLLSVNDEVETDTRTVTYVFDTLENLIASKEITTNTQLAITRTQLMQQVMARNNIQPYTLQSEIVHDEIADPDLLP